MPKRSSRPKNVTKLPTDRDRDPNKMASAAIRRTLALAEESDEPKPPTPKKDPAAVALGRRGGLKGGRARMASLTPEQRTRLARKAAKKRWAAKRET
jgi:hypothetical protein